MESVPKQFRQAIARGAVPYVLAVAVLVTGLSVPVSLTAFFHASERRRAEADFHDGAQGWPARTGD